MPQRDRRQFVRQPVNLPVKIRIQSTGRYLAAQTVDASAGGLLIRLACDHPLPTGTAVQVGIPEHSHQAVLAADRMQPATICRSMGHQAARYLAVAFNQPVARAASA